MNNVKEKPSYLSFSHNPNYLYISSSFKDSYVRNDKLIPAYGNKQYQSEIFSFLKRLSRRTAREKLPCKFSIIDGSEGEATQARIIIRCPMDWTAERFKKIALNEWGNNSFLDVVISASVSRSLDMDLSFLEKA